MATASSALPFYRRRHGVVGGRRQIYQTKRNGHKRFYLDFCALFKNDLEPYAPVEGVLDAVAVGLNAAGQKIVVGIQELGVHRVGLTPGRAGDQAHDRGQDNHDRSNGADHGAARQSAGISIGARRDLTRAR